MSVTRSTVTRSTVARGFEPMAHPLAPHQTDGGNGLGQPDLRVHRDRDQPDRPRISRAGASGSQGPLTRSPADTMMAPTGNLDPKQAAGQSTVAQDGSGKTGEARRVGPPPKASGSQSQQAERPAHPQRFAPIRAQSVHHATV